MTVPKPVTRLTEARIDQDDVARALKAARHLIKAGNYLAARESIGLPLDDRENEVRRLRILGESWKGEGRAAEAAECLKRAYEIQPTSHKVAAEYLSQLTVLGNFRTAIAVYHKLSKRERRRWEIVWEAHRLYERIGWLGHADSVRRAAHVRGTLVERVAVWLRLVFRPLLMILERRQLETIRFDSTSLSSLNQVNYQSAKQRYQVHSEVDRALISSCRMQVILDALFSALRLTYVLTAVAALTLYLLFVAEAGALAPRLAVGLVSAGLMVGASKVLWDHMRTYAGAMVAALAFISASFAVGIVVRQMAASALPGLIGQSLLVGTLIAAIFVLGAMLAVALEEYLRRRVNRQNARGMVMGHLADLITEMSDPDNREYRTFLCWKLESAAKLLERDVPRRVSSFDDRTDEWVKNRCAGAAEGLRHIKMLVLSPAGGSWDHFTRLLRHQLSAIATENWRNVFYRKPAVKKVKSRKDTLKSIGRLGIVALLPAVSLYAVAPWLDLGGEALKWARIVAVGWAVLSLLFALDPTLREKVETAGSIVSTARGSGSKSRPESERAPE